MNEVAKMMNRTVGLYRSGNNSRWAVDAKPFADMLKAVKTGGDVDLRNGETANLKPSSVSGSCRENPRNGVQVRRTRADT